MTEDALNGRTIAIPESRELKLFAELLERRGAQVLRCPLLSIVDAPDPAPVLAWIERFNAGTCDDLILYTGEGLRRLLSCIEQHEPELRAGFVAQLARVRRITRGPKPGRVLRELGLKPDLTADPATTDGLLELLRSEPLRGRRIGVQLYGQESNQRLTDFLGTAGAEVSTVAPYAYADETADGKVLELVDRLYAGTVDAIAFTSAGQVERLHRVAERSGRTADLHDGLARCIVAAVGPVVAAALHERELHVDVQPQESYFLKPLTQALIENLTSRR